MEGLTGFSSIFSSQGLVGSMLCIWRGSLGFHPFLHRRGWLGNLNR